MSAQLTLDDIRRAWDARDPELVHLLQQLIDQDDPIPEEPIREGALTFDRYLQQIRDQSFRQKEPEEQMRFRVEQMKKLEAPDAEIPLPERLKAHEILFTLWEDNSLFARQCLLRIIKTIDLAYGPWRALKKIFKEAEERDDTEIFGALAARFDMEFASNNYTTQVSRMTLGYLVRRAWRYLRRLATQLPVAYPDVVGDFLIHYNDDTSWHGTWIANHVFYHNTHQYTRTSFSFGYWNVPDDILTNRAYPELWQRTHRPLFSLLERAQSEQVRKFATKALQTDFRATLREVEPSWVARLVYVESGAIDDFVIWILNNVPRFEQGEFRQLGLHDAVLKLFDSNSANAQTYAADYARTHARDLPVPELIRLMRNDNENVRKLAENLLTSRDPRTEVGLDAWGELLESDYGHQLGAKMIRNNFGASELTPEWFQNRLLTSHQQTFEFAKKLLPQIHAHDKLGPAFYQTLLERRWSDLEKEDTTAYDYHWHWHNQAIEYSLEMLPRFDVNDLSVDFLQRLMIHPSTWHLACNWIDEGRLNTHTLPMTFYKCLAFHPDWDADPWVNEIKEKTNWAKSLHFSQQLCDRVLGWLQDVRRFSPSDLGFDWLMKLVMRSEEQYHNFALETMTKSFVPADFAPKPEEKTEKKTAETVDFGGESFLFTGKLATMKRAEAEQKVKDANGVPFKAVSSQLHYLVVGDEGSPLYGQGKKGNKQVKAEELNGKGANIQIISETRFLQMISGETLEYSDDAVQAGCERLWEMAIAGGADDAPLAKFARWYVRRHHEDLCQEKTDRPVDPGAEMPREFFTWQRVGPLLDETRKPLRELALELSRWEFARWSPPVEDLLRLSESSFVEVRNFVTLALLADDSPEHERYRINPDSLSPDAVYSFCESSDEGSRALGMKLIERSTRLQIPEELFRLTESPDRRVRAFVIRTLWSLYRERGITKDWKPSLPPQPSVGEASRKEAIRERERLGMGAPPRPDHLPTEPLTLRAFLRRILFEIPPGRMEAAKVQEGILQRVKPLPARKSKLYLIEMLRDLAEEQLDLAREFLPLLEEFRSSRGKSEHDACLVAITRIRHRHGESL